MIRPPKRATRAQITQRDLEGSRDLRAHRGTLKEQLEAERERLLGLIEAGAPVEPGTLVVGVELTQREQFTHDDLRKKFGERHFEVLRQELPPTLCRKLVIEGRDPEGPPPASFEGCPSW